ncbi:MAG: hypothetical protein PWQ75_630 [Methanolobus sp.]|jgi:hypothetical protein|uniref:hypothetical protein n=1 Tax=Methanolobus sp. TaxID=1874737 RepID=UPI00258826D7|nr:hypothetical protein [Methanolobus sp.]MDK2830878.1 hypothetical protein [Methanolobus sp.]
MSDKGDNKEALHYLVPSLLVLIGLIFTTSSDVFVQYDENIAGNFDYLIFVFFIGFVLQYIDFGVYSKYLIGVSFLGKVMFASSFSFILFSYFILKGVIPEKMNIKLLFIAFLVILSYILMQKEIQMIIDFIDKIYTELKPLIENRMSGINLDISSENFIKIIMVSSSIIAFLLAIVLLLSVLLLQNVIIEKSDQFLINDSNINSSFIEPKANQTLINSSQNLSDEDIIIIRSEPYNASSNPIMYF